MDKKSTKKRKGKREHKGEQIIPSLEHAAQEDRKGLRRKWYLLLACTMFVALLSYSNSVHNQFVFDDNHLLLNNLTIRGIEKIPRFLSLKRLRSDHRPVRGISYTVDYTLNKKLWHHLYSYEGLDKGLNPVGYHIANCAYHLVTSLLVFLLVFQLASSYRMAFLAASLFALHPVHTDSVTYLSGRRDILVALFYLAGFYFFLRYRHTRKITYILVAFLSYLLSLGSKEMGVTLPALFLCYDLVTHLPEKIRSIHSSGYWKELFRTCKKVLVQSNYFYSFMFSGALLFTYYKVFIKSPSQRTSYYGDSILTTFLTVGKILLYYLKLLVYPVNLNADYSYDAFPLSSSFLEPATLGSFIVVGILGYGILRMMVTHKMAAFGLIWFFVTLLPVCHIFPHHELLAEHYLYLPSFGFCLVVASVLNHFLEERRYRYPIYISLAAVALFFSLRIAERNRDWKDAFTLWQKTIKTAPQCARAHVSLGNAYNERGELDKAIAEYKQGLAIRPHYAKGHVNLGDAYAKKKLFDKAIAQYKKVLDNNPNHAEALAKTGASYLEKGMLDEAIPALKKALAIKPSYAEALANLGTTYQMKGMLDEAIAMCKKALALMPTLEEAHINLGIAYGKKGLLDEAISHFNNVLRINSDSAHAYYNRAIAYDKKGMLDEAIKDFIKVLVFNPDDVNARFALGNTYIKKGMQDEAIAEYKKAFASKAATKKTEKNKFKISSEPPKVE